MCLNVSNDIRPFVGFYDRQAKQDASEPLAKKAALEDEKIKQRQIVQDAEIAMRKLAATVGNLIHPDVPVSNNEVRFCNFFLQATPTHSFPHLYPRYSNPTGRQRVNREVLPGTIRPLRKTHRHPRAPRSTTPTRRRRP